MCLIDPPAVFDCIEFNAAFRRIDVADELSFLAMECDRLARPDGQKFRRVGILATGYSRKEVDAFAARLVGYFQHGKPMSIDQVRTVTFTPQRGGYHETQVDVVLDSVVDVMLAVRQ